MHSNLSLQHGDAENVQQEYEGALHKKLPSEIYNVHPKFLSLKWPVSTWVSTGIYNFLQDLRAACSDTEYM